MRKINTLVLGHTTEILTETYKGNNKLNSSPPRLFSTEKYPRNINLTKAVAYKFSITYFYLFLS